MHQYQPFATPALKAIIYKELAQQSGISYASVHAFVQKSRVGTAPQGKAGEKIEAAFKRLGLTWDSVVSEQQKKEAAKSLITEAAAITSTAAQPPRTPETPAGMTLALLLKDKALAEQHDVPAGTASEATPDYSDASGHTEASEKKGICIDREADVEAVTAHDASLLSNISFGRLLAVVTGHLPQGCSVTVHARG